MLFCQLGQAHSLREICGGLVTCLGKMKHLGVKGAPHRSTLAYANEHRPWELYQKMFYYLLAKGCYVSYLFSVRSYGKKMAVKLQVNFR
jgi:heme/copper-type cytochrome/quinol oxidase subunit 1